MGMTYASWTAILSVDKHTPPALATVNSAYFAAMYRQALAKFRKEMEAEAHLCGCNVWKDHANYSSKDLQNGDLHKKGLRKNKSDEKEKSHLKCKSRMTIITSRIGNSVAVGTDDCSGIGKVLQARKKIPKKTKKKHPDQKNIKTSDSAQVANEDEVSQSTKENESSTSVESTDKKSSIKSTCVKRKVIPCESTSSVNVEEPMFMNSETRASVKENAVSLNSSSVHENVDVLEKVVEENGDLAHERFLLMLRSLKMVLQDANEDMKTKEKSDKNTIKVKAAKKKVKLHVCAHCKVKEAEPSTFKRCSRCKSEKFPDPRYYCGRDCQVEDWEESHRDEHQKNAATQ